MIGTEVRRGLLFVLVGPGGAGKNTLMRATLEAFETLRQLATATTRPMRDGEQHGREHLFVTREKFQQMIATGELLEWQEVTPGKFYGVPRSSVETALANGQHLIADIEVYGAQALRVAFRDDVVLIFVTVPGATLPAQLEVLRDRMGNEDRNESAGLIQQRLDRARDIELPFANECEHVIVNDDIERAVTELKTIIQGHLQARTTAAQATERP